MKTLIFRQLKLSRSLYAAMFLVLPACDRKEEASTTGGQTQTVPSLVEGKSSRMEFSWEDHKDPDLMSLNPLEDGWDSEHLNAIAGEQLARLGEVFETATFTERESFAELFADEVQCGSLRPMALEKVFEDGATVILRAAGSLPARSDGGGKSWAEQFSALANPIPQGGARHAKFKIIGVQPKEGGFVTKQLVSLSVHDASMAWEQNATWTMTWVLGEGDDEPKIAAIVLEEFEEVRTVKGGTWFTDCTGHVFSDAAGAKIAREQFGVGIGHWKDRLSDYLLVMQFGHNGIALGDVNGDGFEDLYRCQLGGLPNRLFLGQPDGTVRDAAKASGLDFLDNSRGALFVDLDNDGDQDLVLAMPLQIVAFKNDGAGKFEIGARFDQENVFSLAAADYDSDGDLDLYGCVYYAERAIAEELPIPMPLYDARNGGRNVLLRNEGSWKFNDATKEVGLDEGNSRFSYSAIWEDYDNDGLIDLYVVNDFGPSDLYRNRGGEFRLVTKESGTMNGTFGMSAASGDYNRDGWMDFYKASMYSSAGNRVMTQPQFLASGDPGLKQKMFQLAQGNTLFTNNGKGAFHDDGAAKGVGMGRWSWGSIFLDFNNDGWEDIFVTNGFVTGREEDDL